MSWIDKILPSGVTRSEGAKRSTVPEGVWTKCIKCEAVLYRPDLERNANVCPKCGHHMRLGARQRLDLFLDAKPREELFQDIEPIDRLRFRDKKKYTARLAAAQKATGERDALVAMRGSLQGISVITVAFEFSFHGGSMGQAVGEKFSRAAQLALKERVPLVCFAASGGARMQEALISLMQMAKTSAVIERMHSEGVPYISVMTDPIYGGVSASLALLGDLNIAEPEVRAGFAGPNIIEQTIRQKLPKGFQRSEFLLEHGAIDMIVPRNELRDTIARILSKLMHEEPPRADEPGASADDDTGETGTALDGGTDATDLAPGETGEGAGVEAEVTVEASADSAVLAEPPTDDGPEVETPSATGEDAVDPVPEADAAEEEGPEAVDSTAPETAEADGEDLDEAGAAGKEDSKKPDA